MHKKRPSVRWLGSLVASGALSLAGQSTREGVPEKIPMSVVGAAKAISQKSAGKGVKAPHFAFSAYQPDRMRGVLVFQGGAIFYGTKGAGVEPLEGMELPQFPGIGGEFGPGPMLGGDGGFWVVAGSGLHRLKEGQWVRSSQPLTKDLQHALRWGNAWVIDKDNVLFFSTRKAMVGIYDPATWAPRWEQAYPVTSRRGGEPTKGGIDEDSREIPFVFLGPEIVISGQTVGVYYHNSGRIFRFETERRKLEELDVPWVTWGRDEGKRGRKISGEALRSGARVEAEFPLDPVLVPIDANTVYLIGGVSGQPDLWRSCEFNLDRGDAKLADLSLEPPSAVDSPIQLPRSSGLWVSLNGWLTPKLQKTNSPN